MEKTFVVTTKKDIKADGNPLGANEEIAVITTNLAPLTLLGMIQFGHAEAIEVTPESDPVEESEKSESIEPVEVAADEAKSDESDAEGDSPTDDGQGDQPGQAEEPEQSASESLDQDVIADQPAAEDAFVADGLDKKIASVLVSQGIDSPDKLRGLIASNFDLSDLDGMGRVRIEKILAIYGEQ